MPHDFPPPSAKARRPAAPVRLTVEALEARDCPSVAGVVFRDFNSNGVQDALEPGLAGVSVSVIAPNGTVAGTTATNAAGQYSLNTAAVNALSAARVEFSTFPTGLQPTLAGVNGSVVEQFVSPSANPVNVNLGLANPTDYSQPNPFLASSFYHVGDPTSPAVSALPDVVSFPYGATNQDPYATLAATGQVGTTWGEAWNATARTLYVGAFMKLHAGFGPDGTGAIYAIKVNPNGTAAGTPTLFADVSVLLGGPAGGSAATTGANPHPNGVGYDFANDTAVDAVGKIGLGGMALSADGLTLFVMNLNTNRLLQIAVNPDGSLDPTLAIRASVPVPDPTNGARPGDVRPFAVEYHDGAVYVGLVDSAQSSRDVNQLAASVYRYDPVGQTFGAAPVLQFALNYVRGARNGNQGAASGSFRPWQSTVDFTNGGLSQPWLTSLAFDSDGSMIVGLRDRLGDQGTDQTVFGTAGDVLRAARNANGTWTLESDGVSGGVAGSGAGDGNGPGGGQYYGGLKIRNGNLDHEEVGQGSVLQRPGFSELATTSFDPLGGAFAGGLTWLDEVGTPSAAVPPGNKTRAYELYENPINNQNSTFGKSNGVGGLTDLSDPAPVEIGGRVWNDTNRDGVQQSGEFGIPNVAVGLFLNGNQVGTTTTNSLGKYYFNDANVTGGLLPSTAYQVRIDTAQANLAGYRLSPVHATTNANIDSDAQLVPNTTIAAVAVTTGTAGTVDEFEDAGLSTTAGVLSLGNQVFLDADGNGRFDPASEPVLGGVAVDLLPGNTPDGQMTTAPAIQSTTTNLAGQYTFANLAPGTYRVRLAASNFVAGGPLAGLAATTQVADPTFAIDNANKGTTFGVLGAGGVVGGGTITLAAGSEPDGGGTANLRYDFGLLGASIRGRSYLDFNRDGMLNGPDSGLRGITVTLFDGQNHRVGSPQTTDATGAYAFLGLAPGTYTVVETPPAGYGTSTPSNYTVGLAAGQAPP